MRILLTESLPGSGDATERELREAGHEVLRCVSADGPAFPCHGLASGDCPADTHLDAAVTVRAGGARQPTPREMGVVCALRHHVPVVVAGAAGADPLAGWARAAAPEGDTVALLAALEEVVDGDLPAHARTAAEAARRHLATEIGARAHREGDHVVITLVPSEPLDDRRRETVAVHVAGAVRRFDRNAGVIDVAVAPEVVDTDEG